MARSAGILLPLFSLPSDYGIGSLGAEAREFLDFLRNAGQRWWQMLPLTPGGGGNSPYSSASSFAGNPLLLDLPRLAEDGLLTAAEVESAKVPGHAAINYGAVLASRETLLRLAFRRGRIRDEKRVAAFRVRCPWVEDYALYQAAKTYFGGKCWLDWEDEGLRARAPEAVAAWREKLSDEVEYHVYVQYLFDGQWAALKAYAGERGVGIIGDLPIYVALDSADVWSERQFFRLDEKGHPVEVAGVPPDYFSEDGQLWGNPLYDWERMRADGFGWWIRRIGGNTGRFDAIRIDHFRAFAAGWCVPYGEKTARKGVWRPGPGMDLVGVLTSWFSGTEFLAEDLGLQTPDVARLLKDSRMPGMRVLEFAFSDPANAYLPHNCPENALCYTGTHDNDTLHGWYRTARPEETEFAEKYLNVTGEDAVCEAVLRAGQGSVAKYFIAQLQDYLGLGSEGRINVPGTVGDENWSFRLPEGVFTEALAERIRALTALYGRCPEREAEKEALTDAAEADTITAEPVPGKDA